MEHERIPQPKGFQKCSKHLGTSKAILNKRVPKVFLKNSLIDTKSVPRNPVNPMQQEVSQTCHYETRNVVSSLGISLMTLRRTVSLLREVLGTQIFDKEFGDRGYSEKTLYCLQLYFEYRKQGAGRERAAKYVKQQIEQQQQNAQKQPA